jgi:hypothetical protein
MVCSLSFLEHFSFHNVVIVGHCLEKFWDEFYAIELEFRRGVLVIQVKFCQIDKFKIPRCQA